MATPSGTISFQDINRELELQLNNRFGLGDQQPRYLCGILNGTISMNDLKNKRYKSGRIRIGSFSVGGGGTFDMKNILFKNKYTCVEWIMFDSSKYEKYLKINQYNREWSGAGIWHKLPYPWLNTMDTTIWIRWSADWHSSWYDGFKLYPDGIGKGV